MAKSRYINTALKYNAAATFVASVTGSSKIADYDASQDASIYKIGGVFKAACILQVQAALKQGHARANSTHRLTATSIAVVAAWLEYVDLDVSISDCYHLVEQYLPLVEEDTARGMYLNAGAVILQKLLDYKIK